MSFKYKLTNSGVFCYILLFVNLNLNLLLSYQQSEFGRNNSGRVQPTLSFCLKVIWITFLQNGTYTFTGRSLPLRRGAWEAWEVPSSNTIRRMVSSTKTVLFHILSKFRVFDLPPLPQLPFPVPYLSPLHDATVPWEHSGTQPGREY